jgi:hypothetical protein
MFYLISDVFLHFYLISDDWLVLPAILTISGTSKADLLLDL